ncbi:hypothetical protein JYB64_19420 [Algoriphagus aestuarii]|nr:hypothetical protein [Algoriphagus aestuarii]
MKLPIVILFLLFIIGCDPIDDKLIIDNQTQNKIYFALSPHDHLSKLFEEGLDKFNVEVTYKNYVNEIEADSKQRQLLTGGGNAWERYINETCQDSMLRVFTFNIDTLNKYSWSEIIEKNYYLKKIELSVKDLEKQGWQIKFH